MVFVKALSVAVFIDATPQQKEILLKRRGYCSREGDTAQEKGILLKIRGYCSR